MPRPAHEAISFNWHNKAETIYYALKQSGVSLKLLKRFGKAQWAMVADWCKYDHISPECRGIVADLFEHPEKLVRRVA